MQTNKKRSFVPPTSRPKNFPGDNTFKMKMSGFYSPDWFEKLFPARSDPNFGNLPVREKSEVNAASLDWYAVGEKVIYKA